MQRLISILTFLGLNFCLVGTSFASTEVKVNNWSDSQADVFFMALGCVKWVDDLWTICEKKTIPAHTEITYTFPGGTSAQEVLIRPQEVTKMLMNNFDMDPNWGKFAWDWVNAFKDTVQKGPKGLYSFKKPFQDLFDIKGKLDLSHLMSVHRASAPLYKNPVVTLDQFGAGKIIEKMKKMITESQAKKK